mmetsp:Transcript_116812/g.251078  ORF Transcript_116812/g.251078 Transcript_116812/m.251078 type:complete len:136 (+) Transcript_116812:1649-2056(+)
MPPSISSWSPCARRAVARAFRERRVRETAARAVPAMATPAMLAAPRSATSAADAATRRAGLACELVPKLLLATLLGKANRRDVSAPEPPRTTDEAVAAARASAAASLMHLRSLDEHSATGAMLLAADKTETSLTA